VEATPSADEPEVCSARLNVSLPVSFWSNGKVQLHASLKLPNEKDPINKNSSLFGDTPSISATQTVNEFTFISTTGLQLNILTSETTSCNFCDLRQWCPDFEVRVGGFGGTTWKKGDTKKWSATISVIGSCLRFDDNLSYTLPLPDKKFLMDNGYIHLKGFFSRKEVEKALRIVNQAIKEEGAKSEFSSKHTAAPQLSDLLNFTKLRGVLGDLVGLENLPQTWGAQIALVFPKNPPATPIKHMGHHIDGEPNYKNDPKYSDPHPKLNNFTALVGVYLSDTQEEDSGNFSVFPGTHYQHAEFFKANGGADTILNSKGKMTMPPISLPAPIQIKASMGDVVIANYLLAHTVACNVSAYIRYALYFRITSNDMKNHRDQSLTDPWLDWPGLKTVATSLQTSGRSLPNPLKK